MSALGMGGLAEQATTAAGAAGVDVLDLDEERIERARVRAARRAGRGDRLLIRSKGVDIAVVEAEFPLDVLAPFVDVNVDLALLVRQAIDLAQAEGATQQLGTLDMIVSVLAANPQLPQEVIDAAREAARRLLGEAGYETLLAQRPTPWDIAALIRRLLGWYGVSLGESSSPSTDSGGGATSKPTSPVTTAASMSTGPGFGPGTPGSSEFGASQV